MTSLSLAAGQLRAEATTASADDRIRSGILVPWGEPGRTNLGLKKVHRGALTLTADAKIVGIYGHNREAAVSRVISTEDREDGLFGRIKVARTALGDQLLAEIDDGARDALSIEFSDLEFDAAGDVTAARLDFVAHVPVGAYDSARIDLAATVNDSTGDTPVTQPDTLAAAPADDLAALRAEMAELRSALPSAASVLSTAGLPAAPEPVDAVAQLATMQAAQATGETSMLAALADITNSDLPIFQRPAGAVPQQLWANSGYTRRYVPLLTGRPLTSYKFGGWEFTQLPEVGDWAGDKTEIPTNEVATREIEGTAARLAGGWDVDRKYRDFGDSAFWTAFYAAQTESYARKSDAKAAAAIIAARQSVTGTAPVVGYTRPAGYGTPVEQADILRAVAFGTAYLEDTPLIEAGPDYVLMNTQDWLGLLDMTNLDLPAFLALMGVSPGSFLRSNLVPQGEVVLGVRRALEWYELPGAAPIRVEALDVARGGIDSAVYGYWGTLHVRPGGVISVPLVAG